VNYPLVDSMFARRLWAALNFLEPVPGSLDRRTYKADPQALFRAEGIWLWGIDDETLIHEIRVGSTLVTVLGAIPGRFFEAGLSFDEFRALLNDPNHRPGDPWFASMREPPSARRHQINFAFPTCSVGRRIAFEISGPCRHLVLWGQTVL
jgi:hypothetical protein